MYCEKNRGSKNCPNDGAFYSAWNYINSDPHHMILGLSESQDAILLHILFSDYYLIYLFFDRPIVSKHQNIGTVFLPTVQGRRFLFVLTCYQYSYRQLQASCLFAVGIPPHQILDQTAVERKWKQQQGRIQPTRQQRQNTRRNKICERWKCHDALHRACRWHADRWYYGGRNPRTCKDNMERLLSTRYSTWEMDWCI